MGINLIEEYDSITEGGSQFWRDEFNKWKSGENKDSVSDQNEQSGFRIGDIITFTGGMQNNIRYTSEILGFSPDGRIYVLWDCYWFPIKDEEVRKIIKN